jgi:hypothetical protein
MTFPSLEARDVSPTRLRIHQDQLRSIEQSKNGNSTGSDVAAAVAMATHAFQIGRQETHWKMRIFPHHRCRTANLFVVCSAPLCETTNAGKSEEPIRGLLGITMDELWATAARRPARI